MSRTSAGRTSAPPPPPPPPWPPPPPPPPPQPIAMSARARINEIDTVVVRTGPPSYRPLLTRIPTERSISSGPDCSTASYRVTNFSAKVSGFLAWKSQVCRPGRAPHLDKLVGEAGAPASPYRRKQVSKKWPPG